MKIPEIKISYSHKVPISQLPKIACSADAYKYGYDVFDKDHVEFKEYLYMLSLNNSNRVLGYSLLGIGGSNCISFEVKECLQISLKTNAKSVIFMHNHPSGNDKPSDTDIKMHNRLRNTLQLLDIAVLDSIIVTPERGQYYSFGDNGL